MIMVTHDLQVAARADRIIHLQDGRIRLVESRADIPTKESET
jgi:predicted ABC-type transport system involved in lysophospholipase L1 biosynthesis ATPase subunit